MTNSKPRDPNPDSEENTLKRERRDLASMAGIFLIAGVIVTNLALAYDNPWAGAFGGVVALAGAIFGILWATHD